MASEQVSKSVRAFTFLLTGAVLAAVIYVALKRSSFFERTVTYNIHFTLADGVAGLAPGSEVQVGGLKRGTVESINPEFNREKSAVLGVDVTVRMYEDVKLYKPTRTNDGAVAGAEPLRIASLLGNLATINFRSVGTPDSQSAPSNLYRENETIDAVQGAGMLPMILGPEMSEQVSVTLNHAANFVAALDVEFTPAIGRVRTLLDEIGGDYQGWRVDITASLSGVDRAIDRVNGYLAPSSPVDTFLGNAVKFSGSANDALSELRTVTLPKIDLILDDGISAVTTLDATLARFEALTVEQTPNIRTFLSEAREAATQLKLGTVEVRRNPWRILFKPGIEAVANENLWNAAADFAMATSDLRVASEGLNMLLQDPESRFLKDEAFRREAEKSVLKAMDRYKNAREYLDNVLRAHPHSVEMTP